MGTGLLVLGILFFKYKKIHLLGSFGGTIWVFLIHIMRKSSENFN